ncbi:hypothetical protein [Klebsiella phage phiKp_21]|uniref:Uncharacterized protein n=1 Tax=Klebsiella phage vB_KleM_RaK2 TaxID=1147094 RepID=H6X3Y9_9CAUD|nr:virion structural protein [Klebsiella phage vB_KleM_RaK2]AFA44455.1 hypothetical protein RaK2_00182 [Klebsiella phage vB_KleM_RaK2]QOE32595.1 hypothetical protein CPT_Muenster_423 [Klebsiella phage Muenster]UYL05077.1 hypothetical protein DIDNDMLP_00086 [Klebsiella phage KP13-7]BEH88088.1 hypothetical protein [Klebsiella phage phiKp_21]
MSKDSLEFILRCDCGEKSDHVIHIAQYDLDEEYGDNKLGTCLISARLEPCKTWYERVWIGIKYIFGYNSYQYMDTMVDVDILREVVQQLKDERSEEDKKASREKRSEVKVL